MSAPLSRSRINEVRRLVDGAAIPDAARRRKLAQLDAMEDEWVDEIMRRWHRRRGAPFRAIRREIEQMAATIVAKVDSVTRFVRGI